VHSTQYIATGKTYNIKGTTDRIPKTEWYIKQQKVTYNEHSKQKISNMMGTAAVQWAQQAKYVWPHVCIHKIHVCNICNGHTYVYTWCVMVTRVYIHSCLYVCRSGLITLQCIAVCCSVLQYAAVCCSTLQCVAACCSVLQCV